jgi:hypothetical protein
MKSQKFPAEPSRYRSYVVRCWRESSVHAGRETTVWRFSLQDPGTGQRRGFATLEALMGMLQAELADDKAGLERQGSESLTGEEFHAHS